MFRTLKPHKVYITEDVFSDPRAVACTERIMSAIDGAVPERVSYEELDRIAQTRWNGVGCWGETENPRDPDVVMTMAKFWSDDEKERFKKQYPALHFHDLWGFRTWHRRADGDPDEQELRGCICHSAWELHSAYGCPFRCGYCGLGGAIRMFVNMEEYVEHLDELMEASPHQRLYKWDNQTDVSCFEPEWGASKLLVEYFADKPDKYLEIYTGKSDNVDDLLELDPRGKSIIQWSVSAETQSTMIEKETAPWDRRIEAMRKCQEAGYIVRCRFSPIVPVKNWEEENAALIDLIFEKAKPDVISLCAFGWMDFERTKRVLDLSLLDERYVAAMAADSPFIKKRGPHLRGGGTPIPHEARAHMFKVLIDRIRSHNKTIPVSLCLETPEMWALFERELGMTASMEKRSSYYCNCGGQCTPEHPMAKGVKVGKSYFAA